MTMRRGAIAATFVCIAAFAPAKAGDLSPQYDKCIGANTANMAYANCGQDEVDRQDKRLNTAWNKVATCMSDNAAVKKSLLDEQRLWIKWKEASCLFYDARDAQGLPVFGREGQVLSLPACRATVIAQRAKFLEDLAKEQC